MAADGGEIRSRATLETQEFLNAVKQMTGAVQKGVQEASSKFEDMSKGIGSVIDAVVKVGALVGFTKIAQQALETAEASDRLKGSFEALNGATAETAAIFAQLEDLEVKSTFDFEDTLGPAAEQMMRLGVGARQTADTVTALVDAAAALRQGPEWITQVAEALAKMQSRVVASTRDMQNLEGIGVGAWQALAKAMGVSVTEAMERVKEGTVSARQVIAAVTTDLAQKHKGAAEESANTWKGAWHNIKQTAENGMKAIGDAIKSNLEGATPLMQDINQALKDMIGWFTALPKPAQEAAIVFTVVTAAVIGLIGALIALKVALVATGFSGWVVAIGAVAGALAVMGKWIYDNWPAINAALARMWQGVKEEWDAIFGFLSRIVKGAIDYIKTVVSTVLLVADFLAAVFGKVVAPWKLVFEVLVGIVKGAIGLISGIFKGFAEGVGKVFSAIGGVIASMPGFKTMQAMKGVWDEEQKKLADSAKAADAKRQADEAAAKASKDAADAAKLKAEQDRIAANAAEAAAERRKKAAEEAKKAAEAELKLAEDIRKGYEALKGVSPEIAEEFAAAMGGVREDVTETAKTMGSAWDKMSTGLRAMIEPVMEVARAFKQLGVTPEASLEAAAEKAEESFQKISDSGMKSAADVAAAQEAVVAAYGKITEYINRDLKLAFEQGKMTAASYYAALAERAQETLDAVIEANEAGKASELEVLAARREVAATTKKLNEQLAKDSAQAYAAFGLKSKEELNKAGAEWIKFAAVVTKAAGEGTRQALEAQVKALEEYRKTLQAQGKDFTKEQLEYLANLKQRAHDAGTDVERLTAAFKALSITSLKDLNQQLDQLAIASADAAEAASKGQAANADAYAAQRKLAEETQKVVDRLNQSQKDAYEAGRISAQEYFDSAAANAEAYARDLEATADGSAASTARIAAAWEAVAKAQKAATDNATKEVTDSYHRVGLKTRQELEDNLKAAEETYARIAENAEAGSEALLRAEAARLRALKELAAQGYGEFTKEQEKALRELEKKLKEHAKGQKDVWGDLFKEIGQIARAAKDELIGKIFHRLFEDPNKELKQQEAELRKSLAERATEWEAYVADINEQQAQATADYESAMAREAAGTAKALDEAAQEYAEYAEEVKGNIEEIKREHSEAAAEEIADLQDSLAEKEAEYAEYADDVADRIEEIREKYREQLEEETEELREALEDRKQEYDDFIEDVNTKLGRVGEDAATNISDETEDTKRNISERQRDYQRYSEDTQRKIAEIRAKNGGVYTQEEGDLQTSLRRRQEDLDSYIDEQSDKLDRYVRDQQTRQQREEQDLKESLERRTREWNEYQQENAEKQTEAVDKYHKGMDAEVAKQKEALADKKQDLDEFTAHTAEKIEETRVSHAAEQDAEIAKQQEALAQKKSDYDTHVSDILLKSDEQRTEIEADYASTTASLKTELGNQLTEYENFKQSIIGPDGKLEQLKAKHVSIWDDIKSVGTGAMEAIGNSILKVASDEVIGLLTGKASGLGGILGGLGKLLGIGGGGEGEEGEEGGGLLGGLGNLLGGLLGGGKDGKGGGLLGGLGGLLGGLLGGGKGGGLGGLLSGGLGSLLGGLGSLNPVGMFAQAGAGLFSSLFGYNGIFGQAEKDADVVNKHTLETVNELRNLRGDEWSRMDWYFLFHSETWKELQDINYSTGLQILKSDDMITRLTEIRETLNNQLPPIRYDADLSILKYDDMITRLTEIRDDLRNARGAEPVTVNVQANGITTPEAARALGDQIASNMTRQMSLAGYR